MAAKKKTSESENAKVKRLLKELSSLSPTLRVFVAGESFGGEVGTIDDEQIIIYTGMKYDKDGEITDDEDE